MTIAAYASITAATAARPAAIGTLVLARLFEQRLEIRDLKTQALLRTHERASSRPP